MQTEAAKNMHKINNIFECDNTWIFLTFKNTHNKHDKMKRLKLPLFSSGYRIRVYLCLYLSLKGFFIDCSVQFK